MNIKNKKRGFSLVETLVALALILVAVLVLMQIFPGVRKGMSLSENRYNATKFGGTLLDQLRKGSFDAITPSSGEFDYQGINNGATFSQKFKYQISVENLAPAKKAVTAIVTWNEPSGQRQVKVETIIVNVGG